MTPERIRKVDRIYQSALDQEPGRRAAFVTETCQGDEELREVVESLLDGQAAPPDIATLTLVGSGTRLGRYLIEAPLGSGGMGEVFRGRDTLLQRTVAIKVLPRDKWGDEGRRRRFLQEARAASALNHPNIVTFHDIGSEGDTDYLVMEYVAGLPLNHVIPARGLPAGKAVGYAVQVAEALEAAHAAGIVHRDIKPANLIVTPGGTVKVLDFGIAKVSTAAADTSTGSSSGDISLTRPGKIIGTLAYMSPEQAAGQEAGPPSDVFSLGVVMYEMVAGHRPFLGTNPGDIMQQVLLEDPLPLRSLRPATPQRYCQVVEKSLRKDPAGRYQSATEMLSDLRALGGELAPPPRGSRRFWIAAMVLAILALAAGLIPVVRNLWFPAVPKEKKVVVLPFLNVGGDPANQVLCDGLLEVLTTKLTQLEQFQGSLWVVSASEVRAQAVHSARDAERAFGVNMAISGSLQRIGGHLRLTANLIDVRTQRQLRSLDERVDDVSQLQDRVIADIASMLELELRAAAMQTLANGKTAVSGAFDFYLQGYGYLRRLGPVENADSAIILFERALAQDPGYALAYSGLAEAYWRKYIVTRDSQWVQSAKESCAQALKLNDRLAPVHVALGQILRGTGQADEAVREYLKAIDLDPGNPDAWRGLAQSYESSRKLSEAEGAFQKSIQLRPGYWAAYSYLAAFYTRHGRYTEAEPLLERVIALTPENSGGYSDLGGLELYLTNYGKAVDILQQGARLKRSATIFTNLGNALFLGGRYAESAVYFKRAVEAEPGYYIHEGNLADAYRWSPGLAAEAAEAYRRAVSLAEKSLAVNPKNAAALGSLALYHAKSGNSALALTEIEKAEALVLSNPDIIYESVVVNELAGRREKALAQLAKLLQTNYPADWIRRDPELVKLRRDTKSPAIVQEGIRR